MLKADSSTLKNPSAAQTSPMPPMIESSVACSWISVTTSRSRSTELFGKRALELLDEVARLALLAGEATSDRERKSSGTKESSAK